MRKISIYSLDKYVFVYGKVEMLRSLSFTPWIQLHGPALLLFCLAHLGVRNLLSHHLLAEMFVPDRSIKRIILPQSLLRLARIFMNLCRETVKMAVPPGNRRDLYPRRTITVRRRVQGPRRSGRTVVSTVGAADS